MKTPSVEILMGTKNGAQWLDAQLRSIAAQQGVRWRLVASDDGSSDGTRQVLDRFASHRRNTVRITTGPGQGAAKNFLSMLRAPSGDAAFTALSDQDDIWRQNRLLRAIRALGDPADHRPRLYASRTWELGETGGQRLSRRHPLPPSFRNALLQNILPGNTMVMNRAAREVIRRADTGATGVPFHDWWIYLLLTGAGGQVIFDDRPGLWYRQHRSNLLGANTRPLASVSRARMVLSGIYAGWLSMNVRALKANTRALTPAAQTTLDKFSDALAQGRIGRVKGMVEAGVHRQTRTGTLLAFGGAALSA